MYNNEKRFFSFEHNSFVEWRNKNIIRAYKGYEIHGHSWIEMINNKWIAIGSGKSLKIWDINKEDVFLFNYFIKLNNFL